MLEMFGMTLLERQLRTITEAGLEPAEISVWLLPRGASFPSLPEQLVRTLPLRWIQDQGSLQEQLVRAVQEAKGEPLLVLEADAVIDARLLCYVGEKAGSFAVRGGEGAERTAVLRLEREAPAVGAVDARLSQLVDAALHKGVLRELPLSEVPTYIWRLRRDLPAYLFRIADEASRDQAERFLFWSNYKGSTDFFTKYVYPPLVWRMVRPLARWRVHPNVVTLFNVFITLAAVPLFARGQWVAGLVLAYTMSVLDSVDGKLARLTFRSSWFGNVLDHGLDLIHPPLWYFAWAWALGGGSASALIFQAAIWMAAFYFLDRIVIRVFTARTGKSIHSYMPLDVQMRTFISRRNINVPIFTIGLIIGIPVFAFVLIVLWQVATLTFHVARLIQYWNGKTTVETPANAQT
jgi:phosphatidylglycerophosphate synthase